MEVARPTSADVDTLDVTSGTCTVDASPYQASPFPANPVPGGTVSATHIEVSGGTFTADADPYGFGMYTINNIPTVSAKVNASSILVDGAGTFDCDGAITTNASMRISGNGVLQGTNSNATIVLAN